MPGLCAFVLPVPDRPVRSAIDAMAASMKHHPWHRPACWTDGTMSGLGVVSLEHVARHGLFTDASSVTTIVFDGEIYDADRERTRLGRAGIVFEGDTHAELLLRGYRAEACAFLRRLHGVYAALIWDGEARTLTVITDRFGMRPMYAARPGRGFVAASAIAALRQIPGVDCSWDEDGVAQFFAFGHFLGDSTLAAGVRALPAAILGTYRAADDSYGEECYVGLRPTQPFPRAAEAVDALDGALTAAVERRARPGERLGLSLSGGLDARTILALMPSGLNLKTVSLGIEGSLDHRSSSALAALAGVPHTNYVLDAAFLSEFETHLRAMIRLTDGHYLDQGIVMPTIRVYRDLGIDHLHRGHGGELLHMRKAYAYSLDDAALVADEPALEDWLFAHLTAYMLAGVPGDLFTFDVRGRAREALRAALARTQPGTRPVDRVWQLFIQERLHRETGLSMAVFDSVATVRMPFIDNDVVDVALSVAADLKLDETLQAAILRRRRSDFLTVVNANTGAAVGASRVARVASSFRMRVAAKLGVKGYQPYERLGLWLRRELRALVRGTLLSDEFASLGLFRPEAVRRVVERHEARQANHTFLLMALLIVGIGREGGHA
jgi:asparagine synthase (glutamine-hydrolysing)